MKNTFVRIGTFLLALIMVVAIAGCGGSKPDDQTGDASSGNNKKPPSKVESVINDNHQKL